MGCRFLVVAVPPQAKRGFVNADLTDKHAVLLGILRDCAKDGLTVAFSGGVDSSFLTAVAYRELGDRVLAVTAESPLYAEHERNTAIALAKMIGVRHILIRSDELEVPGFADNPPNRCYLCKRELFGEVARAGMGHGLLRVADGTNADDSSDYRPGRRAAREAGVISPLLDAGLTKNDIRILSRGLELPSADKPAMACLASRFPYGTRITASGLRSVGAVEDALRQNGVKCYRVRFHDTICRLEIGRDELASFVGSSACRAAVLAARQAGFLYVTLDLEGYRTGSMNATLSKDELYEGV